jgi:apolipoprotein N-acyltransferase
MAEPWSDGDVLTAAHLAGMPWGVMGYASISANQSGITTVADVTGLSVTFTAVSTRLYRTTVWLHAQQLSSGALAEVLLTDGSDTILADSTFTLATNDLATFSIVSTVTAISGSHTRKVRARTAAGSLTIASNANNPGRIIVEDIGAA